MIGDQRRPNEACGILLPFAVNGRQVFEIANRSPLPHDSFTMLGEDISLQLEMIFERMPMNEAQVRDLLANLTYWHTHPGGNIGPSKEDIENKPKLGKSLVVTLKDNEALATWF